MQTLTNLIDENKMCTNITSKKEKNDEVEFIAI